MEIVERRRDPATAGTLKVVIPSSLLVKLHAYKVMTGTNIATTVETALTAYFDEVRRLKAEARNVSAISDDAMQNVSA